MVDGMLVVWYRDGSCSRCEPDGLAALTAAMERFVGDGAAMFSDDDRRDSIVHLKPLGGRDTTAQVNVLASHVANWNYSTRATRAAEHQASLAVDAERATAGEPPHEPVDLTIPPASMIARQE